MDYTIYFDMDGVLADFVDGVLKWFHRTDLMYDEVRWEIEQQLGVNPNAFWAELTYPFWRNLKPYADGMQLFKMTEATFGKHRIVLVTSPCDTKGCYDAKKAWVKQHLPGYEKRIITTTSADVRGGIGAKNRILIDDNNENIAAFLINNGHAIQPARPWNNSQLGKEGGGIFNPIAVYDEIWACVKDMGYATSLTSVG